MGTNWTSITTPETFLQIPNTNTGGFFWASVLAMISIVLLISMLPFGFEAAILAAAFAALMIGVVMVYLDLVAWIWVAIYAGVLVLSFLIIMYSKKD